jgi:abnormal spindle-like microcephaly-associated protein
VGITIFEDVVEDQELVVDHARPLAGSTLLAKPAQKRQTLGIRKGEEWMGVQPLGEIGQARRSTSVMPAVPAIDTAMREEPVPAPKEVKGAMKKDPRRRTIFVPSDDTTILTIHPGANTTDRLNDTFHISAAAIPPPSTEPEIADQVRHVRKARMSLAVAPKRVPLQHMATKQANVPAVDMPGQNGGKENVPPAMAQPKPKLPTEKPSKPVPVQPVPIENASVRSRLFEPTAASQARQSVVSRKAVPLPKTQPKPAAAPSSRPSRRSPLPHSPPAANAVQIRRPAQFSPGATARRTESKTSGAAQSRKEPATTSLRRTTPPKRTIVRQTGPSRVSHYPVLTEDVAQPQLYEESWLNHQEIALTELINSIFAGASSQQAEWQSPLRSLRERLLDIYHRPSVTNLHQRLQASLQYGALSRSKSSLSAPDPKHDLGLRRRFLNLWLNTYDEDALRAAAEVVVGRQVPRKACSLPSSLEAGESVLDPSKGRRSLIAFLETFLVSVEDVDSMSNHEPDDHAASRRWRKMVLRSLMLVWLLDQAKTKGLIDGCLFHRNSSLKCSTAVLHSLSSMLMPSTGDITRALRHYEYEVSHVQDPLNEVVYSIENIAVDLRDGIFLTRLVEVLLFKSQRPASDSSDQDATVTISLPDLTVLESALYAVDGSSAPRILSQHLKMPCPGRAQKLHNVQVALSALAAHGNLAENALTGITADDIVDGHREKTLSLLWALVSHHGLAQLVDWDELTSDIRRTGGYLPDFQAFAQNPRESLLRSWAAAYASLAGIQIHNLTTSFSDPRVWEAVLDGFSDFLPTSTKSENQSKCLFRSEAASSTKALERKLRALGCSNAFTAQLTKSTTTIPSQQTTISNLVFLASRLLPLSRRQTAAEKIQRAYRRRLSRMRISQRIAMMRIAHACATVVQTRNRIVDAAVVLQRAWRKVVDARISRLNKDVSGFQVMAKGWLVRRKVRKAALGYGNEQWARGIGVW